MTDKPTEGKNIQDTVRSYFRKKGLPPDIALAFDDVVILDKLSDVASRSDITNLKTRLAGDVSVNIPMVSANMPDVTDARMAIALARLGGCGFIPQFASIEKRVEEIQRVKRAESEVIEKPVTIAPSRTIEDAAGVMKSRNISGLLVVNDEERLIGIITSRDIRLQTNMSLLVNEIMTPRKDLITGSPTMSRQEARSVLADSGVEKLPLIDKEDRVVGLMTAKDLLKSHEYRCANRDDKGRLVVGATVGVSKHDVIAEVRQFLDAGADVIMIDTARAYATMVADLIRRIKKRYPEAPLIVGNIDRAEAAKYLIDAGADALKVGIGPGSACKTREETGIGIPQLTAVAECVAIAREHDIPVIADGGIRTGAHLAKALVAGASCVMLGGVFAGTDEAPGDLFYDDGRQWKMFRGSASLEAQVDRIDQGDLGRVRPTEGVQRRVPYKGKVSDVVRDFIGHLRSSMSYVGARSLVEYHERGGFRRQSRAGFMEGRPRPDSK